MMLTRSDDIREALRNPALSARVIKPSSTRLMAVIPTVPFICDPPEHTRIRRILQPFLGPKALAELLPDLQAQAAGLVAAVAVRGRCEVMRDIAHPFPMTVYAALLGLPLKDRDRLLGFRGAIRSGAGPNDLIVYLAGAISKIQAAGGGPGLLPQLLTSGLTPGEAIGFCWLIAVAGTETVTSVIGSALLELARNPQLRARLRQHPEELGAFADETIRIHPPITAAHRIATKDVTIAGTSVPKGSVVTALLGRPDSGQRSISVAEDGSVRRRPHWGYGSGIHRCLGVHLAKMEVEVILTEWLRRITEFNLAPGFTPRRFTGRDVAMLDSLPLRWE